VSSGIAAFQSTVLARASATAALIAVKPLSYRLRHDHVFEFRAKKPQHGRRNKSHASPSIPATKERKKSATEMVA
jgi:hypothetical protein